MSMGTYFPNDVLNKILLQLPVKSIGRCKCVCRQWNSFIQDPSFVTDRLNRLQSPTCLFVAVPRLYRRRPYGAYEFKLFGEKPLSLQPDIQNPINSSGRECQVTDILGPVNGLYFMSYYSYNQNYTTEVYHQALWNPSTSELRELPLPPPSQQNRDKLYPGRYFGFGSAGKDIKVIHTNTLIGEINGLNSDPVKTRLYSLNDDSWKDIQSDLFLATGAIPLSNDIFNHLNGVYYWLTKYNLISFDMKSEEFREVNLPNLLSDLDRLKTVCVRDNSSIVLFVNHYKLKDSGLMWLGSYQVFESIDLWEKKDDGEWFKLLSLDCTSSSALLHHDPYGFWNKDEILIQRWYKKAVFYNINSHELRCFETGINEINTILFLLDYKENLTSIRGASETRSF